MALPPPNTRGVAIQTSPFLRTPLLLLPLLLPLSCLLPLSPVKACSLPPGACTKTACDGLAGWGVGAMPSSVFDGGNSNPALRSGDPRIGFYYGLWNKNALTTPLTSYQSVRGGPWINYEIYPNIGVGPEAGFLISMDTSNISSLSACCNLCRTTPQCQLFQWFGAKTISGSLAPSNIPTRPSKSPNGFVNGTQCYLLQGGSVNDTVNQYPRTSPFSGTHSQQSNLTLAAYPPSWVGGWCNPGANVTDDPHFVGAHGTRYDFNGDVNKVFVLLSDKDLHLNIKLGGYLDSRTYGATKLKNGLAIRTWITELGLLWKEGGVKHTLVLTSRRGAEDSLDSGYLSGMTYDGEPKSLGAEGVVFSSGALTVSKAGVEHRGIYDLESFLVEIKGLLTLRLHLRPAHPLLRTAEEAFVHFNVQVTDFEPTPAVHGVLGQTFRLTPSRITRALEYRMLSTLLGGPIAADGETGTGFLDGQPSDYEVQGILSTNSKFSTFV